MIRIRPIAFYPLLVFFLFSFGLISSQMHWWPASFFHQALMAYNAQLERNRILAKPQPYRKDWALGQKAGDVITYDKQNSDTGYNLIAQTATTAIILTDMYGRVVHKWYAPFRAMWKTPPHIKNPVPERVMSWFNLHLYPDGSILGLLYGGGDTPYGYGLIKMDKYSQVLWAYPAHAHHDLDLAENGDIYVITQDLIEHVSGFDNFTYPILTDYIAILSPDGEEKKVISLLEAFKDTPYHEKLEAIYQSFTLKFYKPYDIFHTNSVQILSAEMAKHFPMFEAGDLLLSIRNINALAILDPKTEKIKWLSNTHGAGVHSAQFSDDGTIIMFDNLGLRLTKNKRQSRILKYDPAQEKVTWQYTGPLNQEFFSRYKGIVRISPNGNLQIVVSDAGRLAEINKNGKIVWAMKLTHAMNVAKRYPLDYFDSDFCALIDCSRIPATAGN